MSENTEALLDFIRQHEVGHKFTVATSEYATNTVQAGFRFDTWSTASAVRGLMRRGIIKATCGWRYYDCEILRSPDRPRTEQEARGGKLPKVLKAAIDRFPERISVGCRNGALACDLDDGFDTPSWDVLLAAGWHTNDGGHRQIIETRAADAAYLIRNAQPCDCDDCQKEKSK